MYYSLYNYVVVSWKALYHDILYSIHCYATSDVKQWMQMHMLAVIFNINKRVSYVCTICKKIIITYEHKLHNTDTNTVYLPPHTLKQPHYTDPATPHCLVGCVATSLIP